MLHGMRIVSWNVNGLRALVNQGYWKWFTNTQPDIFCIQETKTEVSQLSDEVADPDGYHAYFNSSRERKGYSGVATYSKKEPTEVLYDVLPEEFNKEGRLVETRFSNVTLLNVYFPNGGRGKERLEFKLRYYDAFLEYIEKLRSEGMSIIFCGDINTAHEEIDIARARENETNTGFLPEERAWLDELINLGYVDTFRHFYPNAKGAYTYWDVVTRARDRNVGWRIDYFFVSPDLVPKLKGVDIHADIFGSDHCPISLDIAI